MSELYDKALAMKPVPDRVRSAVTKALGLRTDWSRHPQNDKHRFFFHPVGLTNAMRAPIHLWLHMSYGWYGDSSCYSTTSEEVGEYAARACTALARQIGEKMVELAEADAEAARKAAEAEARSILEETAE